MDKALAFERETDGSFTRATYSAETGSVLTPRRVSDSLLRRTPWPGALLTVRVASVQFRTWAPGLRLLADATHANMTQRLVHSWARDLNSPPSSNGKDVRLSIGARRFDSDRGYRTAYWAVS